MADARSKAVMPRLADLYSRSNYAIDLVTQLREPLAKGDIIEVPDISALTVTADGSTGASAQSVTTNVLSLNANLHPAIFARLPQVSKMQLLDSKWADQVANQAVTQLKNNMDETLLRTYLARSLAWTTGTAATYHTNVAGDALTEDDILNAKADILANDGAAEQNLIFLVAPHAQGAIMSISGFVPNFGAAEKGVLGIPRIGEVFGVPVYVTNSVLRNHSSAITASAIASNVLTVTVAAGHGWVAGQTVQTDGLTTDQTTSTAITSTTATTVVLPLTSADAADNGTSGTLLGRVGTTGAGTCWSMMLDAGHIFAAQQEFPGFRIVSVNDSTDDELQVYSIYGRIGRAGRAMVVHSPGSTVS